jgi:uncharacterized protein (TIGR03067 family)
VRSTTGIRIGAASLTRRKTKSRSGSPGLEHEITLFETVPPSLHDEAALEITGRRFISFGMGAEYEGTIELDPTQNPKHLNMKFDAGPEKGNVNRCIYQLEGDVWKICIATTGSVRPSTFDSLAGSGFVVEVLHRIKP